jgi:hypothetical protein
MKRLLAVSALSLLAALALPSLAPASHSNGSGPNKDLVNGTARGPVPTPCGPAAGQFHANGQSTTPGTGANGKGQFFTRLDLTTVPGGQCLGFTSADFSGDITCVNAFPGVVNPPGANGAVWGGVITKVLIQPGNNTTGIPGILAPGVGVLSRHIDNGSPGAGNDRAVGFTTTFPPTSCPPLELSTSPIEQGNLIVHDGV